MTILTKLSATLFASLFFQQSFATVVTYPATPGMSMSGDYIVNVGGQSIPVYRGAGPLPYSFAYFDFSVSAAVQVTSLARSLSNVVVRPQSKGVIPSIVGNVMTFTLTQSPTHLSIEPDAKNGPLLLFANPLEVNRPTPGAAGVVYFGPGLHKPNMIFLSSGQTLYIAGGAVVQAGVFASGNNITIRGRGMLDGLPWYVGYGPQPSGGNRGQILAENMTNLNIEGIILKDSWYTAVGLSRADYVNINNLKIVANRHDPAPPPGKTFVNGGMAPDGLHYFNSSRVSIADSFIRTDDDCIAPIISWSPYPVTDGLTVTRTSLWTDRANIWRIGSGFQRLGVPSPAMKNLVFTDIDVLHYDKAYNPAIRIMPNIDQAVENVRFENIRINHEGQAPLVEIKPWPDTRAPVRNVYFKNISVTGSFNGAYGNIIVHGADSVSTVTGVTFENFMRHGQLTLATSSGVSVNGYTSNIAFFGSSASAPAPVPAPAPTPAPTSPTLTSTQKIEQIFQDILGRASDPGGLSYFVNQLNSGASILSIRGTFANSAECNIKIKQIYSTKLGRAPTSTELASQINYLTNYGTLALMSVTGAPAPTSPALTSTQKIEQIYQDILGRASDPGGLSYFVNQLNSGASILSIRGTFANSAECNIKIKQIYSTKLGRAPTSTELASQINYLTNYGTLALMKL